MTSRLGDWEPEELERRGRDVLGLIREHFEHIDELPVLTQMAARDLNAAAAVRRCPSSRSRSSERSQRRARR